MKNKKTLAVIAAALLAVSPVAAGAVSLPSTTTVKAATQLSSDQLMAPYYTKALKDYHEYEGDNVLVLKLTKATPYLTAYDGETVHQLSKRRITDVTPNYGRVTKRDGDVEVFKTMDNGDPDFNAHLNQDDKLQKGQNYVAVINFDVENTNKENEDIVGVYYYTYDHELRTDDFYDGSPAAIAVPVNVESAPAKPATTTPAKKSNNSQRVTVRRNSRKRAYVKTRKNRRVRT